MPGERRAQQPGSLPPRPLWRARDSGRAIEGLKPLLHRCSSTALRIAAAAESAHGLLRLSQVALNHPGGIAGEGLQLVIVAAPASAFLLPQRLLIPLSLPPAVKPAQF